MRALGLRAAALPRATYAFRAGFPMHLSGLYVSRAIKQGLMVVEVWQAPPLLARGCIPRLPCAVVIPAHGSPPFPFPIHWLRPGESA